MKLDKFSMQKMSVTEMNAIRAGSSSVANGGSLSSATDTYSTASDHDRNSADCDYC